MTSPLESDQVEYHVEAQLRQCGICLAPLVIKNGKIEAPFLIARDEYSFRPILTPHLPQCVGLKR